MRLASFSKTRPARLPVAIAVEAAGEAAVAGAVALHLQHAIRALCAARCKSAPCGYSATSSYFA